MALILSGFPTSGKSFLGAKVARVLNWSFCDLDTLIEQNIGLSCRDMTLQQGEATFRELEKRVIASLNMADNTILATGGGSILFSENVAELKKRGPIIYLQTEAPILWERICQKSSLPSYLDPLAPKEAFDALYERRLPYYEKAADYTITTALFSENGLLDEITKLGKMYG